MLIKSLKMQNFRQFKGITAVDFSCDPEQNVTIILGDNTFGKTTLLQAFNWCFYETVTFDNNPDFLLNLEVANEMNNGDTETVSVEICVIHNGVDYVISRSQTYSCANGKVTGMKKAQVKVSYKQEDGQMESVRATEVQKVIENILPQDLSTLLIRNAKKQFGWQLNTTTLFTLKRREGSMQRLNAKHKKKQSELKLNGEKRNA